jgi:hypothetical protein
MDNNMDNNKNYVTDFLENQSQNPNSLLNNFLNGRPVAEFSMANSTIIKLSVGLFVLGVSLIAVNKYVNK